MVRTWREGIDGRIMDMEFTLGNVRNIIILEVKDPLCILDNGADVTRDEELGWLRKVILKHESPKPWIES
jgi:hypothetical protein